MVELFIDSNRNFITESFPCVCFCSVLQGLTGNPNGC